ncbi:hypothetical protein SK128_016077, partial [Halocaridina rubra]
GKRKINSRGRPRKKLKRDSEDESTSEQEDDPDFNPESETGVEEEFQGPFLNVSKDFYVIE